MKSNSCEKGRKERKGRDGMRAAWCGCRRGNAGENGAGVSSTASPSARRRKGGPGGIRAKITGRFIGRPEAADARRGGTGGETAPRTRGGDRGARGRERGRGWARERERETEKTRNMPTASTYESHVVRNPRSSLAPAATAETAPHTSGTRSSRGRKHSGGVSSSDATRARRRFEVIYRAGCESK